MRQASIMYRGMFNIEEIEMGTGARNKFELSSSRNYVASEITNFMNETSLFSSEVSINSQTYKTEDIVVIRALSSDFIEVGLVEGVLFKDQTIIFVVFKL